MRFIYIFSISVSLSVLLLLFINAYQRRRVSEAKPLMVSIICIAIWTVGTLLELLSEDVQTMLFWRNIQLIGVFTVPVSCIYFTFEYCHYKRLKKYLPILLIVPATALVLVFTDSYHHIMRLGYSIFSDSLFGHKMSVQATPVEMMFISYNFVLVAVSLFMLGLFATKVAKNLRNQVLYVMLAIMLVFIFAFVKMMLLDNININMPVAVLYLPSGLILFYSLFKHDLMYVSPIARNKVFDVIEQGIIVTNGTGTIMDYNPYAVSFLKSFFRVNSELTGKSMSAVFSEYPYWVGLAIGQTAGELELQLTTHENHVHYFRVKVYPLQSDKSGAVGTVSLIRDITMRRLQEVVLKKKANIDGLTDLLNRSVFIDAFSEILKDRSERPVSVLMLDIDRFKVINDTYGHLDGDKVLVHFAETVKGVLCRQEIIGRLGGDEFAAVLPGISSAEALEIAERIRVKIENQPFRLENGETIAVTLSIGIADSTNAVEAEVLLNLADKALYCAKKASRNCCMVWAAGA